MIQLPNLMSFVARMNLRQNNVSEACVPSASRFFKRAQIQNKQFSQPPRRRPGWLIPGLSWVSMDWGLRNRTNTLRSMVFYCFEIACSQEGSNLAERVGVRIKYQFSAMQMIDGQSFFV